jgi:integrase
MGRILLTDKFCAAVKYIAGGRNEYADAQVRGLRFRVLPSGLKDWSVRYTSPRDGTKPRLPLGNYPGTTLATARGRGMEVMGMLDARQDPRLVLADAASGAMTVSHLIDSYLEKHVRPNLRSHGEVERRLRRNVEPLIGGMKLADLHRRDIARTIDVVLARDARVQARHVHGDLGAMLNWAVGRGTLDQNPAAGLPRPAPPASRDRVLSDVEIHKLWHALPTVFARNPSIARTLKLSLVTAARIGEVAAMKHAELDLKTATWTIPGTRSKNRAEHNIPLTDLALDIIREEIQDADNSRFVFPSPSGTGPLTLTTLAVAKALARAVAPTGKHPRGRLGIAHFTAHDLRRSALTNLAKLGVAPMTIAHCANHRTITKAGITFGVYVQHNYEPEKRAAMNLWAARLAAIIDAQPAAEILPLQSRKRG